MTFEQQTRFKSLIKKNATQNFLVAFFFLYNLWKIVFVWRVPVFFVKSCNLHKLSDGPVEMTFSVCIVQSVQISKKITSTTLLHATHKRICHSSEASKSVFHSVIPTVKSLSLKFKILRSKIKSV